MDSLAAASVLLDGLRGALALVLLLFVMGTMLYFPIASELWKLLKRVTAWVAARRHVL